MAVGYNKNAGGTIDWALVRYNSNGSLDTTFGVGGIARDAVTSGDDYAFAGALQPDGKILVAGWANGETYQAVARLNPDGTLDATFGSGGNVLLSFSSNPKVGQSAFALALQGDGKILVGGTGAGTAYGTIVRLNTNGTLDTSFGSQGVVAFKQIGTVYGLTTQIITSGTVTQERIVAVGGSQVVRLTPTGSLDTTFGPKLNGTASTTCNSARAVAVDAANNIVVAGSVTPGGSSTVYFAISRFTPNGTVDTTFGRPASGSSGSTGFTSVNFFDYFVQTRGLAIQSDGKLLVSGTADWLNSATNLAYFYFGLARFNPDGTLDSGFGTGGVVATA